ETVPTEPPPKTCSPSATGNGGGGGGGGGGKRGRAVLRPPEKLEAVKVASSLGLQGPSAPIGAQLLATGGSEDAPTATVYHANLVAGSNTSVVTAALQQPILASLNSAALASMQASAEANSRNITTMEWLYKKEPLFTLAHFWQQTRPDDNNNKTYTQRNHRQITGPFGREGLCGAPRELLISTVVISEIGDLAVGAGADVSKDLPRSPSIERCHSTSTRTTGSLWVANHRGRFDPLVQDHEPDPVIAASVEKETRYRQSPSPGRLVLRM
ncbi:hypothetical protein ALC57_01749, partial [Trachymyrmex cornetzi]